MKRDLPSIERSKRAFRRELAERPIAEKLRMLDLLRERTLAIRRASASISREQLTNPAAAARIRRGQ